MGNFRQDVSLHKGGLFAGRWFLRVGHFRKGERLDQELNVLCPVGIRPLFPGFLPGKSGRIQTITLSSDGDTLRATRRNHSAPFMKL